MFRINDVPGNGGFLDAGGGLRYNRARMRYFVLPSTRLRPGFRGRYDNIMLI